MAVPDLRCGLDTFCAALRAKNYKNFKPGGSLDTPWEPSRYACPILSATNCIFMSIRRLPDNSTPPIGRCSSADTVHVTNTLRLSFFCYSSTGCNDSSHKRTNLPYGFVNCAADDTAPFRLARTLRNRLKQQHSSFRSSLPMLTSQVAAG
jgi:hypothetical protein